MLSPEWNELAVIADCLAVAPYLVAWLVSTRVYRDV